MRDPRTRSWAPGARFVLAAVALALFGLLSMHGWGSHAGTHSMDLVPSGPNAMSTTDHGVAHGMPPLGGAMVAASADSSATPGSGVQSKDPDGEAGGLLGVCLTVLAWLLLSITLLLVRRSVRIPRSLRPSWTHPVFIGRDRDPPDLLQLCVIRC